MSVDQTLSEIVVYKHMGEGNKNPLCQIPVNMNCKSSDEPFILFRGTLRGFDVTYITEFQKEFAAQNLKSIFANMQLNS